MAGVTVLAVEMANFNTSKTNNLFFIMSQAFQNSLPNFHQLYAFSNNRHFKDMAVFLFLYAINRHKGTRGVVKSAHKNLIPLG